MRYWDTSALVPMLVHESGSELARTWLAEDPRVVTWAWTRVEATAALARRKRQGEATRDEQRALARSLDELASGWEEITDMLAVRSRALTLLGRHPLSAADAAQLAAALVAAEGDPTPLPFVCLDRGLADAAEREGMRVLTWPDEPGGP